MINTPRRPTTAQIQQQRNNDRAGRVLWLGATGLSFLAEGARQSRNHVYDLNTLGLETLYGAGAGLYFPLVFTGHITNPMREGYNDFVSRGRGFGRLVDIAKIALPSAYTGFTVGVAEQIAEKFANTDILPNLHNISNNPLIERSVEGAALGLVPAVLGFGINYRNEIGQAVVNPARGFVNANRRIITRVYKGFHNRGANRFWSVVGTALGVGSPYAYIAGALLHYW